MAAAAYRQAPLVEVVLDPGSRQRFVVVVAFRFATAVMVVGPLGVASFFIGSAEAQSVRITRADGTRIVSGDPDALPPAEEAEGLGDPRTVRRAEETSPGPVPQAERVWLEIGAGVGMTGAIGAGAFLLGQLHHDGCDAPCEVDSVFLASALGLGAATLLVPLAVTLTGNLSGEDGHFVDTLLGYLTGLAVAVVVSSMAAGGGDAFLYPAAALGSTLPLVGAILAFEASSMRPAGRTGPTLTQ